MKTLMLNRRELLIHGAGAGLALGLPPLLASCGDGGESDSQPTRERAKTLFFNLSHEDHAGKTYYLTGGGNRHTLTSVGEQPQVLALERETNAFLRAVPDDQITHHVEAPLFPNDTVTLCYVSSEIDQEAGTWAMSSTQLYIPPSGASKAYLTARRASSSGPLPMSAKRRRYGIAAAMTEQDLREERVLMDSTSHAATMVGCASDLMSLDPSAAHTVHSNHVDHNINVFRLGQLLADPKFGPAKPELASGAPNPQGWATLRPVPGEVEGVPLRNRFGQHAGRIQYQPSVHPELRTLAAAGMNAATMTVKDDVALGADITAVEPGSTPDDPPNESLRGALWTRHDGIASIDQSPSKALGDGTTKMTLKQLNAQYSYKIKASAAPSGNTQKVSLTLINFNLEFRGIFLEFRDANEQPIKLTDLAEYQNGTLIPEHDKRADTETMMYLSLIGPVFTVLGIPVAPGFVQPSFLLPTAASSVRVLSSTMSFQSGNAYPETVVQGTVMTAFVSYGVTTLLCAAGGGSFLSAIEKKTLIPVLRALALEVVQFIKGAMNSNGPSNQDFARVITTAGFWEAQALIVAKMLVNIGLSALLKQVVEAIVADITLAAAEDAVPVAGQISQGISILIGALNLAQTTAELALTPWTYVADLVFTHDLPVAITGDLPKAANSYTVSAMFDDGTPHTATAALPTPVPASLPPVVFRDVPLGGKVNVAVAFVQRATVPGQSDILLGKGTTGLIGNERGAAPTIALEQVAFPISAQTVYQHKQKTSLDSNANHRWIAAPAPTDKNLVPNCGSAGTICSFRSISVRQGVAGAPGYVGYSWQAWNSDPSRLPGCKTTAVGQLEQVANLNTDAGANAQQGYANIPCAITGQGVRVAYSLLGPGAANFYLDTSDPGAPTVRKIVLDPSPAFDPPGPGDAWGVFNFPSDTLLLHPAGHLVSINKASHKFETHRIPVKPLPDAEAKVQLMAQIKSGKGSRPGLLDTPAAAAVSASGLILVLETGNNRIQAFDLGGNPVRHFNKQTGAGASPYSLRLGGTDPVQGWQYLDLAVEFTGYLYVLSFNENSFVYRLDLYHPDQSDSKPIATTMDVNAARLTVDLWRNLYTLNYEVLQLPGGRPAPLTEPSVSLWTPCDVGRTC